MSSFLASPSIIYLGLDDHKDSVTIAVLLADAKVSQSKDPSNHGGASYGTLKQRTHGHVTSRQ